MCVDVSKRTRDAWIPPVSFKGQRHKDALLALGSFEEKALNYDDKSLCVCV